VWTDNNLCRNVLAIIIGQPNFQLDGFIHGIVDER